MQKNKKKEQCILHPIRVIGHQISVSREKKIFNMFLIKCFLKTKVILVLDKT